jgi:hypothetical protein
MISNFEIDFVKYNPRLSESLGRGGAMFVNALQFLLNNQSIGKQQDGKKWVYNTIEQWAKSLRYSTRQIEKIVSSLQEKQIILVKRHRSFFKLESLNMFANSLYLARKSKKTCLHAPNAKTGHLSYDLNVYFSSFLNPFPSLSKILKRREISFINLLFIKESI